MSWVNVAITGARAFGQYQQGALASELAGAQADSYNYQAKVEHDNALQTAALIRRAGARQVGQANAAYAGAGVKVGEGSALEAERYIDQNTEHDAFQAILEGDRRGRGMQVKAASARAQGDMARTAGIVNAMGTVLQGGYKAYNGWKTGNDDAINAANMDLMKHGGSI